MILADFLKVLHHKMYCTTLYYSPFRLIVLYPPEPHAPSRALGISPSGQPLGWLVSLVPATGVVGLCLELTVAGLAHSHWLQDAKPTDLCLKPTAPVG